LGYRGAAWSTFLAYLTSAIIIYYFSQRLYPIQYQWGKIITLLVLLIIHFSIFYFLSLNFGLISKFLLRCIGLFLFAFTPFVFGIFDNAEQKLILHNFKDLFKNKL
ncbi:MAG: polysaccharide biosynthesis C-terminal domain-containing protein, partial [Candidatus Kapaibacteriota bacterium]